MENSHHTGVSTFASRTSPSSDQSLQKSFRLSNADKIELKKISSLLKIKNTQPHNPMTDKNHLPSRHQNHRQVSVSTTRWTEGQLITAVWQKWRFSASYGSFVVQQTFVLRINICGKNPPVRQAANRYASCYGDQQQQTNRQKYANI